MRGGGGGWGVGLGALGEIILHGHTEWVKIKDLTLGNFDSHLRIKVAALHHIFVLGSHTFAMFYAHVINGEYPLAHITLMTFTKIGVQA